MPSKIRKWTDWPGSIILKEIIDPKQLRVSDIAKSAGVAVSVINMILKGERRITPKFAQKLAVPLGVEAAYLLGLEERCGNNRKKNK